MMSDETLLTAVASIPAELFAVVDGGRFDNVDAELAAIGLKGSPLYLEGGDPAVRAAAGHLVALSDASDLTAVIGLARPRAALVIWSWPSGRTALFRHLRTLNLTEIPNRRRERDRDPAFETVLFRHWDPRVIALALPLLDPGQTSRLFGSATGIAFDPLDGRRSGLEMRRPPALPPPPHGMLRFSSTQIETITRSRQEASDAAIVSKLAATFDEISVSVPKDRLASCVADSRTKAAALGVSSDRGVWQWTFLSVMTSGRFSQQPGVAQWIAAPDKSPDRQLDLLFASMAPAARTMNGAR